MHEQLYSLRYNNISIANVTTLSKVLHWLRVIAISFIFFSTDAACELLHDVLLSFS